MTYLWPITHPCLCHVYDLLHIHGLSRVYGPWCIYGLWHIYHPWCIYCLTLMASALPSTHGLPTSMTYGVSVANAHPIPYKLPINFLFVPPAYCACLAYGTFPGHGVCVAYGFPLPVACLWPLVYRQIQLGVLLLNPSWTSQWGAPHWLGGLCQGCKQGAGKCALCMQHTMPHISKHTMPHISRLMQHSCSVHAYMHTTSNTGSLHKTCTAHNVHVMCVHCSCTMHAPCMRPACSIDAIYNCGRAHIPNTPNAACT